MARYLIIGVCYFSQWENCFTKYCLSHFYCKSWPWRDPDNLNNNTPPTIGDPIVLISGDLLNLTLPQCYPEDLQHLSSPAFSHQGFCSSPCLSPSHFLNRLPVGSAPCVILFVPHNSPITPQSTFLNSSKSHQWWQQYKGLDGNCTPYLQAVVQPYIPALHSVVNSFSFLWRPGSLWTILPPGFSEVKWSSCQLQDSRITPYRLLYNEMFSSPQTFSTSPITFFFTLTL